MHSIFISRFKTIVFSGFVAGTLDILAAIFILANGNAEGVLRFIAKGALGDIAMSGGLEMVFLGLLFHYIIAFSFSTGYFLLYPKIPILKRSAVISGLLYGIFIWMFMNLFFLHLTHNPPRPFSIEGSWKGIVILMVAVGLPVSLITSGYYSAKHQQENES